MVRTIEGLMLMQLIVLKWDEARGYYFCFGRNFKIRAIARIVGDYKYIEDSDIRYKHFRDVEWLYCDGAVDVEKFYGKRFITSSDI